MITSHKQLTASLLVSAVLAVSLGWISPQPAAAASAASQSTLKAAGQSGIIQATVRLRTAPSNTGDVLKYLKQYEQVTVLDASNKYWFKVKTTDGMVGYTSSSEKYITMGTASPGSNQSSNLNSPVSQPVPEVSGATIENVVGTGMKYLGTPYEYGSNRQTTTTFDCSDFVRQIFIEGANLKLPADSRQQGAWVQQNSKAVTSVSELKRGDLMFFMNYKGSSASAYAGTNIMSERITHVAMYLGDGKILHTYSVSSGGVRVDNLSASWMNRFLYGGSVIR